jgi:hypothetical protein
LKKPDHIMANSAGSEWVQIVSALRRPFLSEHQYQAHRSKGSVGVPVQVANDAFFGKSDSEVSPGRRQVARRTAPGLEETGQRADPMGTSWREQDAPNPFPENEALSTIN